MKNLNIIVFIKPVPDPNGWDKLKLDEETLLLERDKVPPVINPMDRNALEAAIQIKAKHGGTVSVATMAPPSAQEQLLEALAMGADHAYLLTDRAFAGADTLATAKVLSAAVHKIVETLFEATGFDLILCGAYSLDGSTSSVGPQVAELLGIPELTHVIAYELIDSKIQAHCRIEGATVVYEADLPALLTLDKEVNKPRPARMMGIKDALDKGITTWDKKDLHLKASEIGLAGSPTQMLNIFAPEARRKGEIMQGTTAEMVEKLVNKLREQRLIR